jgi:hypothetical protein
MIPWTQQQGRTVARPKTGETPSRHVRVADDDWGDLEAAAGALGSDRGKIINQFIRWYLRRPGAKLPERPSIARPAGARGADDEA